MNNYYTIVTKQHLESLKDEPGALAFYLGLSMLVTSEVCDPDSPGKKIGLVLGGTQLTNKTLAARTEFPLWQLRSYLGTLLKRNLVLRKQGQYASQFAIRESHKYKRCANNCPSWVQDARIRKPRKPRSRESSQPENRSRLPESTQSELSRLPKFAQSGCSDSCNLMNEITQPDTRNHATCEGVQPLESTSSGSDNKVDNKEESIEREQSPKTAIYPALSSSEKPQQAVPESLATEYRDWLESPHQKSEEFEPSDSAAWKKHYQERIKKLREFKTWQAGLSNPLPIGSPKKLQDFFLSVDATSDELSSTGKSWSLLQQAAINLINEDTGDQPSFKVKMFVEELPARFGAFRLKACRDAEVERLMREDTERARAEALAVLAAREAAEQAEPKESPDDF